ncbi:uncharacterized protein EI90DRAFT_1766655 [Cantharellus anzutake]|uniref:uncharacterized protein n=1 Tax=Cantharellus anzutake TaxID=1750568 RepID=UPI001905D1C7|nr:uncharacterized protein EI90DRAFT_1766655 [Cantharellus anzutake]KAF8327563.1 hypothetical protein EI90DRAFT_1766655 [Cantharellus anzutake]
MGGVFRSLVDACAELDSSSSFEMPDLKTTLLPSAGFTDGSVDSFFALSENRTDSKLATAFKKAAIEAVGQVAPVSASPSFQNGFSVKKQKEDEYEEEVEADGNFGETPTLPDIGTMIEDIPDMSEDESIFASPLLTPAVVQEELEPPGEPGHLLAELISAAAELEAALGETVDDTKPPVRDLAYDPSPPPSLRFESPATPTLFNASRFLPFKRSRKERRQKPAVSNSDEGLADEEADVPPRSKGDDDDDWDLLEAPGHEETNGPSGRGRGGTSLFGRGVVNGSRLAVFKKSTPTRSRVNRTPLDSERTPFTTPDPTASPALPEVKKRGRTHGLSLRKGTTTKFLPAKLPIGSSPTPSTSSVRRLLSSPSSSNKGVTSVPSHRRHAPQDLL